MIVLESFFGVIWQFQSWGQCHEPSPRSPSHQHFDDGCCKRLVNHPANGRFMALGFPTLISQCVQENMASATASPPHLPPAFSGFGAAPSWLCPWIIAHHIVALPSGNQPWQWEITGKCPLKWEIIEKTGWFSSQPCLITTWYFLRLWQGPVIKANKPSCIKRAPKRTAENLEELGNELARAWYVHLISPDIIWSKGAKISSFRTPT